jgi:predicted RNA-binding Zn-ribbon protein involved in translation (DUF1610 family)
MRLYCWRCGWRTLTEEQILKQLRPSMSDSFHCVDCGNVLFLDAQESRRALLKTEREGRGIK